MTPSAATEAVAASAPETLVDVVGLVVDVVELEVVATVVVEPGAAVVVALGALVVVVASAPAPAVVTTL
jgi:hypothetical protein